MTATGPILITTGILPQLPQLITHALALILLSFSKEAGDIVAAVLGVTLAVDGVESTHACLIVFQVLGHTS